MDKPKISIGKSPQDDAWIVFVDTDPEGECDKVGPRPLRIYLNDAVIYENPPFRPDEP